MNYKKLIVDAWERTQNEKGLIFWYGFIPSILTTTFGFLYIAYQFFAFKKSHLFDNADESFFFEIARFFLNFIAENPSLSLPFALLIVFFLITYLIYPTIAFGATVQAISRRRNHQESSPAIGLKYGITSFLPLFNYHLMIKTFSFFGIILNIAFALRNLPLVIFELLLPVMILVLLIGLGLTLFLTFTDYFIIIDNRQIFDAMKKSTTLVWMNWKHTILITFLMILIGIRIIIQAIMIFLIPLLIMLATAYVTTAVLPSLSIIFGVISGSIVLFIASYLSGVVDIFSYTVWTYSFLDLSSEKELSAREVL